MTLPLMNGPSWAHSAMTEVLGDRWPSGDEAAVWDIADRWYALADALSVPRTSAIAAAGQIVAGLVGAGIAPDGFREAWERLAGGEDAPLNALVQISAELGQMVEECGREIEAAKLAASIEVGTLLTELACLAVADELTVGATRPAAECLITASRVAVEQIYDRLAARLAGEPAPRPPTPDPAHSARSDQRTVRLTAPAATNPTARETQHPGRPTALTATNPATEKTQRPSHLTTPATTKPATGETRRSGPSEPPRDDSGTTTRRLAPRPRGGRRDLGDETRRLVAPPSRPATGRPTIPLQRPAGHASDRVRRDEYADFLADLAARIRSHLDLGGEDRALAAYADEMDAEASQLRTGTDGPSSTIGPARLHSRADRPPAWARPEPPQDAALGWTGARVWGRSAEEQTPGGLRRAHAVHRKALEDAVPAADRRPDPRLGGWFLLLNAGGPAEDPTRGVNCLDAVLALFETYHRGRPRVAGPRTFDGYAHGAPDRAVGGEWLGVRRIQRAARSTFQNLCPFVGGASAGQAAAAVEAAFRNLGNHLHNSGHGAFAFILTDFAGGGCHAWAAVNQDGTILFLDPQLGRVSAETPLYREIVSMDALVVDGAGEPAPLPYHGAGQWTAI
jgi:papain fold toxin 1 (glutamine deamidase) of polymorphic toxin system